jgi:phosphoglycerate dehydrogenase-like enzyme
MMGAEASMGEFRVALSGDFKKPDGSPAFPDFDLSPLEQDPAVEFEYIRTNGVITAKDLAGFDALILLIPRIEPASFPADGRLAIIARFGVGFDTVDVQACTDHGCALVTTPDGVRRPVAVAILTFMLALTGRLAAKDRITREGPEGWSKRAQLMGTGLIGRTLGQLGIGNIGAEVFRLAKPFGMRFIAHDPYADPKLAQEFGVRLVGLEELFREADVLSVSCPLNDETHHVVNAERLALMKPTAYLINTSRGPVVDERALTEVLQAGRIAGAGLDVFEQEPSPKGNPLYKLDNVLLTPHALCWTDQCFAGIGAADVKAVLDVMHGRVPTGIVNRAIVDQPAWQAKLEGYRSQFG